LVYRRPEKLSKTLLPLTSQRKTKTVARKPTAAGGFECPYGEVFEL
jgi:hypothetical protein